MRVTVGTLAYHSSSVFAIARVAHCREPSPSGRCERDERRHFTTTRAARRAMGGGRDKRKKVAKKLGKVSADKRTGATKTALKREKNAEKNHRRLERGLVEDDIDAILAAMAIEDARRAEVEVEKDCPRPQARGHASLTATVVGRGNELILYGGERVTPGDEKCVVYGDLYRYDVDRDRWTKVSNAKGPHPRSGHQALAYGGYVYVFGGEFTSPNQERFLHHRDCWRFDLESNIWEAMPAKGGPSARSGHRMAIWGKKAILFGGFYDTGREVRYYNDAWEYDFEKSEWKCRCAGGEGALGPSPRSACHVGVHDDAFIVYGGYCKNVDNDGDADEDRSERGTTFSDAWKLDLKTWRWEKLKRQGLAPSARAGASSAMHALKKRLVLFGGVVDHEVKRGDVIVSEFFTDAYNLNMEAKKWFPVTLYGEDKTKTHKAGSLEEAERVAAGDVVNENFNIRSEAHRAAIKIQAHFRGYQVRKAYKLYKVGGVVSELLYSPGSGEAPPKSLPKPRGRINAAIAIKANSMYLFGGVVELGDVEVSLDDVWKLDLGNRPKWTCIAPLSDEVSAQLAGGGAESDSDSDDGSGSDSA